MLPKPLYSGAMKNGRFPTVEGQFVDIINSNEGEGMKVNDARVTDPDVTANNGIVHTIDRVLMPVSGKLNYSSIQMSSTPRDVYSKFSMRLIICSPGYTSVVGLSTTVQSLRSENENEDGY